MSDTQTDVLLTTDGQGREAKRRTLSPLLADQARWEFVRDALVGLKWADLPECLASLRPDPDISATKYVTAFDLDDSIDFALSGRALPGGGEPTP